MRSMPARRSFTWAHGVFAAAVLALILASVLARGGAACRSGCPSQRATVADGDTVLDVDPETGRILVDLDDDASAEDRLEVARQIASAIGPYEWPSDEGALGEMLSD